MVIAYCVTCKKEVEIKKPKQVTLKKNSPVVEGVCPLCGTKISWPGKL